MHDPGQYDSFARKNGAEEHDGKKIDVIYGIKAGKSEIQALRYPKDVWTADAARSHCKTRGGSFEAAGESDMANKAQMFQNWHEWQQRMAKGCTGCKSPEPKSWYKIESAADESTVYIYDMIGGWGISADALVKEITGIKSPTIHVRLNSLGGSVFDGITIANAIKQHKAKTIAHVDGVAASIASIVALAGDTVKMAENAFMMIHQPWSIVIGAAQDMRQEADLLDKVSGSLITTYAGKSGKSEDDIKALMDAETWFTAQEALDAGFADSIEEDENGKQKKEQKRAAYSARQIEALLHDQAGLSEKEAKSFVAKGFMGFQRDVEVTTDPGLEDATGQRDVDQNQRDVGSDHKAIPMLNDPYRDAMLKARLAANAAKQ